MMEGKIGNEKALQELGLLFARLLMADIMVLSPEPSAVLACVMSLGDTGTLEKHPNDLINDLREAGVQPFTDGFGNSILRY